VIIVAHYPVEYLIRLLDNLLIYFVLVWQQLIMMFVLFRAFPDHLRDDLSDLVRIQNQLLQLGSGPDLDWLPTSVKGDEIFTMLV
jgi:hypothetical protein